MKTYKQSIRRAVLVDGCRIPFLRSSTEYQDLTSYDLARYAIKALIDRSGIDKKMVNQVIMGTVISNIQTSNVAREAALAIGLPHNIPAFTVTLACISSNQAITSGVDLIQTYQADVVIAGGTECMSDIPIRFRKKFRKKLIETQKYKKTTDYLKFIKGLGFSDLLPEIPSISEYSTGRTMGMDCDRLAARLGISREEQDEYALRSHLGAANAIENGLFNEEIQPVMAPPKFIPILKDNGPRADSTIEKLQKLRPAFMKPYGTLTAANSSFLTDGASTVLLMAEDTAKSLGFKPKVAINAYTYTAQDPKEELLLGPAYATPKLLDMTGLTIKDIDVFEFHEAFAAQILANLKCLDSTQFAKDNLGKSKKIGQIPMDKFNTLGGSLSLGHPFGATGARLATTTANRLIREDGQFGLIASCASGAIGNAILMERLN